MKSFKKIFEKASVLNVVSVNKCKILRKSAQGKKVKKLQFLSRHHKKKFVS